MKCPCCDQDLPPIKGIKTVPAYNIVLANDTACVLTGQEFKLFTVILRCRLPRDEVFARVYDGPDGGPLSVRGAIPAIFTTMNKKLRALKLHGGALARGNGNPLYGISRLP